eukprot:19095-Heterococcus_DN1.PRE.3
MQNTVLGGCGICDTCILSVAQPVHQVMAVHQSLVENREQCCNLHYSLRNTASYASCSIDLKAQSAVQYSNIASYNSTRPHYDVEVVHTHMSMTLICRLCLVLPGNRCSTKNVLTLSAVRQKQGVCVVCVLFAPAALGSLISEKRKVSTRLRADMVFISEHTVILPFKTSLVVTAATTHCFLSRTVSATATSARQPHNRLSRTPSVMCRDAAAAIRLARVATHCFVADAVDIRALRTSRHSMPRMTHGLFEVFLLVVTADVCFGVKIKSGACTCIMMQACIKIFIKCQLRLDDAPCDSHAKVIRVAADAAHKTDQATHESVQSKHVAIAAAAAAAVMYIMFTCTTHIVCLLSILLCAPLHCSLSQPPITTGQHYNCQHFAVESVVLCVAAACA